MAAYHDTEWGRPAHDDRHLFDMLLLEGAQAGLSWSTVLNPGSSTASRSRSTADCAPPRASPACSEQRSSSE
ncbi:DNA-3-methyladenine glycosylase I [Streptomyces violaceusniger]|nr:DNA-3-methyladenine glycosylase I [Streptomyces violaceusniger]